MYMEIEGKIGYSNFSYPYRTYHSIIIGKHDTGLCRTCVHTETVEHALFQCIRYNNVPLKLENQIKS